ncbi:MAG: hypothetical protein WCE53_18315 [Candidatus Acidiferrum sp.]
MKKLVPHYETFWQLYVLPLRADNSIWFQDGIDPQIETIAITSYSTFTALGRARHKIYSDNERFRHVEELYMAIQRSLELGKKLVDEFGRLEMKLLCSKSCVSAGPLVQFKEGRLSGYRNLLHDAILAMPKEHKQRLIPKPDKIDVYRSWTRVMYHFDHKDFVVASVQVKNDFRATCSLLEDAWKAMCERHEQLAQVLPFSESRLYSLASGASLTGPPAASGDLYIGHGAANSASARPFAIKSRR